MIAPKLPVFRFFGDDNEVNAEITAANLELRARRLAELLTARVSAGERALLVFPPGLDFIEAFYACLMARIVAVPLPAPDPRRLERTLPRLRSVALAATPSIGLAPGSLADRLGEAESEIAPGVSWLATDRLLAEAADRDPNPQPLPDLDEIAYLQYTSGSTSKPKGVIVTHRNLVVGSEAIRLAWGYDENSRAVMWVPHFHDDGLVHGLIQPVHTGFRSMLLPAAAVVQRPNRWLEAISRFSGTHSGGPNFVYELALRKVSDEQKASLDLSSWKVAYNAAEPVRADTLNRFEAAFGAQGFRPSAFFPSYGLAEATLLVTTRKLEAHRYTELAIDPQALERGGAARPLPGGRRLVGCGPPVAGIEVLAIDPERGELVAEGNVGEIWIGGSVVARGYWQRPDETADTFGAHLADGRGPYLRTGDLGFFADGELYVAGRVKDLIIIRGRNLYPQDLEQSLERSHPRLRPGGAASFSIERGGEERVAAMCEISQETSPDEYPAIVDAARREVFEDHEIQLDALTLVPARSLPKTSSGKLQRGAAKAKHLGGNTGALYTWNAADSPSPPGRPALPANPDASAPDVARRRADELISWVRNWAPRRLDSRLIDERRSFPPSVVLELGERGLFGLMVDAGYGGLGLPAAEALRLLEQLAAIDLTLATFVVGHNSFGLRPLRFARPEVREALLPVLARGRMLTAFALTEPGAGSNPRALSTVAVENEKGEFLLSGEKWWIGSAAWAGVLYVFARTYDRTGASLGISGFAVPAETPGLEVGPESLTLGLRGMSQARVSLTGAPVAADRRLGELGAGFEVAEDAMGFTRLCLAALSLGGMKRAAQLALRYAERREVATGALIDNPVARVWLTDLAGAIGALSAWVSQVAAHYDQGRPLFQEITLALKVTAPELLWEAADGLVQILGGRGYVEPNEAPQLLRDARVYRIFEGPTEALSMHLGAVVASGSRELLDFLRDLPEGEAVAERIEAVAAELGGSTEAGPFGDRLSSLRFRHFRLGEVAAFGALAAAARNAGPLARDWAERRFSAAIEKLRSGAGEAMDREQLAAEIGAYANAIGDLDRGRIGEDHALDPLLARERPTAGGSATPKAAPVAAHEPRKANAASEAAIRAYLCSWIEREVGLYGSEVDVRRPFALLGLDSVTGVRLAAELSDWLGRKVDGIAAWEHPTIEALASFLAEDERAVAEAPAKSGGEIEALLRDLEALPEHEMLRLLSTEGETRDVDG